MDPFHVVHLAADKLTLTRQRIQQDTCGHRGRSGDPLYGVRRILLTRMGLLTDKQKAKLDAVFADERHVAVDVTHWTYQDIIAAYEHPDRRVGKRWMFKVMCRIRKDLPAGVQELGQLGRTMWKRRAEILAYFDTGASNGPVEAINGRLEHLRGIALGFRNLNHFHLAVTDSLGRAPGKDQRTLNPEEPDNWDVVWEFPMPWIGRFMLSPFKLDHYPDDRMDPHTFSL